MATSSTFKRDPVVDYIAQQAITEAETQKTRLEIVKNVTAIQDATTEQLAGVKAFAEAEAMVSIATEGFKAETTFANAKAKAILGLDPNAANYRLEELATTRRSAYENTQVLAKQILDKQSATIFDDPFGWISNQFTLPVDVATHNYYAQQANSAESEFDSIVDSGTKVGQQTRALEATTSAAKAQGELDKITAQAVAKSAEIKRQGAAFNIDGAKALQSLTENDLSHAAQLVQVKDAQERIALSRAQFAATQEQRAIMNEERAKNLQKEKLVEADELDMTAAFNAAARAGGFAERSRSVIVAAMKRSDPTVVMAINHGADLLANGGNKSGVLVARNAADAAEYYIRVRANPVGTDSSTVNFLASTYNTIGKAPEIAAIKDLEARKERINATIKTVADQQMLAIKDNEPNIYAAPSVAAVVNQVPALLNNKFISETLVPIAQSNPTAPTSVASILAAGQAVINKDPARMNEVVQGTANFFNATIKVNNAMKSYAENGLSLQKGFNAAIDAGALGRTANVDVSNPLIVRTYYMNKTGYNMYEGNRRQPRPVSLLPGK